MRAINLNGGYGRATRHVAAVFTSHRCATAGALLVAAAGVLVMRPAPGPQMRIVQSANGPIQVFEIGRRVREFPPAEDLSTPETAYVAMKRVWAGGDKDALHRLCGKSLAAGLPPIDGAKRRVPPKVAGQHLETRIIEVRVFRGAYASVIARCSAGGPMSRYEMNNLCLENGKWLHQGNDGFLTLGRARAGFDRRCNLIAQRLQMQPAITDPNGT